jgi:peroxiredoxin
MTKSILVLGGLTLMLSLFSCQEEKQDSVRPFTDVVNFEDEITTLNFGVTKRLEMGGKIESSQLNNPNWTVELEPFIDADFNKVANKQSYTRTEFVSELSGFRDVLWQSKNKNLPVESAVYRYQNEGLISSEITISKESATYIHTEVLTYVKNMGYSIENEQVLSHVSKEGFYLNGSFDGKPKLWRMFFDIGNGHIVPVNFTLTKKTSGFLMAFHQGKEVISMAVTQKGAEYIVEVPIFQARVVFVFTSDGLNGIFHNLDTGPDDLIPFSAMEIPLSELTPNYRSAELHDFSGKWEVHFGEGEDSYNAIGLFDRLGDDLIGTFATETGDYRFLQGKVVGDSFSLSTFDGSHLFLFTGVIKGDKIENGKFFSGSHYSTTWTGIKNNDFELIDPNQMTSVIDEAGKFDFSFPDLEGNLVSLTDAKYQNKVVVIQILGSWCPNCMDETRYFNQLYSQFNTEGLEIIGLSFERSKEFEKASGSLKKAIKDLNVPYPMLIAGIPKESHLALPMITEIKSYPTSIILNRSGEVVKIHTGFYGPSTGHYYKEYTAETEGLIKTLLTQ